MTDFTVTRTQRVTYTTKLTRAQVIDTLNEVPIFAKSTIPVESLSDVDLLKLLRIELSDPRTELQNEIDDFIVCAARLPETDNLRYIANLDYSDRD